MKNKKGDWEKKDRYHCTSFLSPNLPCSISGLLAYFKPLCQSSQFPEGKEEAREKEDERCSSPSPFMQRSFPGEISSLQ